MSRHISQVCQAMFLSFSGDPVNSMPGPGAIPIYRREVRYIRLSIVQKRTVCTRAKDPGSRGQFTPFLSLPTDRFP
jgi:hypothetical protein